MTKRPRTSEAFDAASPTVQQSKRWSLGVFRSLSLKRSPTEHSLGRTLCLESATEDDFITARPSKVYISSSSSSSQHHHRNTSSVAKELAQGIHSFVTGRKLLRSKVDPYDNGINIDDLALSSEDALRLEEWTTSDQDYENTPRIRDEYLGLSGKGRQMEGIERETSPSETSQGSSRSTCSMVLDAVYEPTKSEMMTLEDLEVLDTLGTGTFGRVLLVRRKRSDPDDRNNYFALKVLNKSQIIRLKQVEHINSERSILSMVSHPFIVNLHCTFQDSLNVYMLMEFVIGGEIFHHLRRSKVFSPGITRFYISCLILAIKELHSQKIIYRDLKPENLLIDRDGYVKITDFGFSKQLLESDRTWTLCGTPEYLSPEVILSRSQSFGESFFFRRG
jgi:hypothetical protein